MSPEDYKILQARVDSKRIPVKDRPEVLAMPIEEVAKLASPKKGSKAKGEMELIIKQLFPDYEKEFLFAKDQGRRYRTDYFIPSLGLCIEYEGIAVNKDEHSRHTHIEGFTNDCRKYNLMQILGYKVLRYTTRNYKELYDDLMKLKA